MNVFTDFNTTLLNLSFTVFLMLSLIGIGLADPSDVTAKGLELIKSGDKVYLETYTSKLSCSVEDLEKFYGKNISPADRDFVESADHLLSEAESQSVILLIIGDPLSATTHWDIMGRAKELGIEVNVVHNASIFSGVAATGLQLYKFGKTASIPHPKEDYKPETAYNMIKENQSIGAHTLCLLDTQPGFMSVNKAIEVLLDIEKKRGKGVFTDDTLCVGCARIGASDQLIKSGKAKEVLKFDFGAPVHCLVVPSDLHFVEEEALDGHRL